MECFFFPSNLNIKAKMYLFVVKFTLADSNKILLFFMDSSNRHRFEFRYLHLLFPPLSPLYPSIPVVGKNSGCHSNIDGKSIRSKSLLAIGSFFFPLFSRRRSRSRRIFPHRSIPLLSFSGSKKFNLLHIKFLAFSLIWYYNEPPPLPPLRIKYEIIRLENEVRVQKD